MQLSVCHSETDSHGKELVRHGSMQFPMACYADDLWEQEVPWHWHEEMEFAMVEEGHVVFLLENARILIGPGEGIFVNARALHGVEQTREKTTRFYSAVFHPRLVGGSTESVFWQKLIQPMLKNQSLSYLPLKPDVPWQAQVLSCFSSAWRSAVEEEWDYENQVRYQLSRALALLNGQCPALQEENAGNGGLNSDRIRAMLDFIEHNYPQDLTVEDIAASAAVSGSVCLRCFREMLGVTPMQYVKQLRLGKASEMLRNTTSSVKNIALACGFNDISYFTKTFREKTGCTPNGYRKRKQGGEN